MKAMILAAGRGERMRPLTDTCPKPLLKIGAKSLIEYHLEALYTAGIQEVVINHAWLGEQIEKTLGNGEKYGLKISYSPETEALETAGGIVQALPLLENQDNCFVLVNGDVFCDYPFKKLLTFAKHTSIQEKAHLIMVDNPEHHKEGDFYLHNGELSNISNISTDRLTYSGIGLYHMDFFSNLEFGKRALGPLLKQAMYDKRVTGEHFVGSWTDVGTPKRLEDLNKLL